MSSNKILTISIPTFNREKYVVDLLQSVISEIIEGKAEDIVEVIIIDNCSADNTKAVVGSFLSYPFVKYIRNDVNIGMTKNLIKCFEEAKGEFCMIYGDDDLMVKDSLRKILKIIKENTAIPVAIFKAIESPYISDLYPKKIDISDAAERYFYYIGNVGIFLVNTALAKQAISCYRKSVENSCWPQTEVLFRSMIISGVDHPLLVVPVETAVWPSYPELRVFNSWYEIETKYYALLRIARNLADEKGKAFIHHCTRGIPYVSNFLGFLKVVGIFTTYYDFRQELKETRILTKKAFFELSGQYKLQAFILMCIAYLPRFIKHAFYRSIIFFKNPVSFKNQVRTSEQMRSDFLRKKKEVYLAKGKAIDLRAGIS